MAFSFTRLRSPSLVLSFTSSPLFRLCLFVRLPNKSLIFDGVVDQSAILPDTRLQKKGDYNIAAWPFKLF